MTLILSPLVLLLAFNNCAKTSSTIEITPTSNACLAQLGTNSEWSTETAVTITGYSGHTMEPQISADGVVLFFNDKIPGDTDMDIHYAAKQPDGTFAYVGKLSGADVLNVMDGVPAIDASNRFYFMSLRDYGLGTPARYRSMFQGTLTNTSGLALTNVIHADSNFPNGTAPSGGKTYLDMDLGVSWDGTLAVIASTVFSAGNGYPDTSTMALYDINQTTRQFSVNSNSAAYMANVNVSGCKIYAPSMSLDNKELYYTVLQYSGSGTAEFRIVVSKRNTVNEAFGTPAVIQAITGYATEGPSISYVDGGKTLYYHKQDSVSGKFVIYKVTRP